LENLVVALAGAVLAISSLWFSRKQSTALQLAVALALPLPGYALAYILSTWPDYERHIQTSLARLLLGLAPVALLAIGVALPKFSRRTDAV
jgi:ABC-type nitrate/sulfonate/bicarbonate transport system permease component